MHKAAPQVQSLQKHKLQNMLARLPYFCDYCGKVFKDESKLEKHNSHARPANAGTALNLLLFYSFSKCNELGFI